MPTAIRQVGLKGQVCLSKPPGKAWFASLKIERLASGGIFTATVQRFKTNIRHQHIKHINTKFDLRDTL